jgi:hypothetical protein
MTKLLDLLVIACVLASCVDLRSLNSPPQSPAFARNPGPEDQTGRTNTAFVDLIKRAKVDCVIESPNLVHCAGPVRIDGLSKTSVIGHRVRVEFSDSRPGKGGIVLVNATNVLLSDIEIGWLGGGAQDHILPGVQRLQSFGAVGACARRDAGGELALDFPLQGMAPLNTASVWDDILGWPWSQSSPDEFEINFPKDAEATFSQGRSDCIPRLAKLVGRRRLVLHIYTNHAFDCVGCKDVTVEKVRITSAPGMAFVF